MTQAIRIGNYLLIVLLLILAGGNVYLGKPQHYLVAISFVALSVVIYRKVRKSPRL